MAARHRITRTDIVSTLAGWFEIGDGKANRFSSMEGLRGLAIFLVFSSHYYDIVWRDLHAGSKAFSDFGLAVIGAGSTGVDLFFVLSGFLIYGAVRKPKLDLRKFFARRIQRIYPTFFAVFVLYLAMSPFLHVLNDSSGRYANRIPASWGSKAMYVVSNAIFLPGIFPIRPIMNVAWSLSYEWFFYMALPLLVLGLGMRGWQKRTRCVLFLSAAVLFLAANLAFPEMFYFPTNGGRESHVEAVMFIGGMVLFELIEAQGMLPIWKTRLVDGAALLLGSGAIIAGALLGAAKLRLVPPDPRIAEIAAMLAVCLFIGCSTLVLGALTRGTVADRLFSARPVRWLGNMSFSFYLFHGLPLHVFGIAAARAHAGSLSGAYLWIAFVAGFPIAFLITAASCAVLFLFVEKPLSLTFGRRNDKAVASPSPSSAEIVPSLGS